MINDLKYYQRHGKMTETGKWRSMVKDIPQDISKIVSYVQNILLHQHWAERYNVILDAERKKETWLRPFKEKLHFLKEKGYEHVSDKKNNGDKMIGICRDFAVAAVSLCREAGIPARARCGFATYFEKDKFIDHWVLEFWSKNERRWILVDPQLDNFQQKELNISFDPLDIEEGNFITASEAWFMCREGGYNPQLFGIFDMWGYDYLKCNLLLDANSLLKIPMQPWDGWDGYKKLPVEKWTEDDYLIIDQLSKHILNVNKDLEKLIKFVDKYDIIRVPDDLDKVINYLK